MTHSLETIVAKLRAPRRLISLSGQPIRLNDEQGEVLGLMCSGMQHKQIAFRLDWKLAKVREVSASTLHLTGCKTPAQLGAWAERQGALVISRKEDSGRSVGQSLNAIGAAHAAP